MKIELGYDTGFQSVNIPDENLLKILKPNPINSTVGDFHSNSSQCRMTVQNIIKTAMHNPIGTCRLRDMVKSGEKVVIITSDITRPMPTSDVLPFVLDELYESDITPDDITLVFALGSHRKHTEQEKRYLAGECAYKEIKCVDSDPNDCIHMGKTSYGTPVDITRVVAEADKRICLGNIEYHYFAGYSGGAKALMPGVSTPAAIQVNHSLMVDENSCAGNLDQNPLRQDLEEAVDICPVDFMLNVVLDEHKRIIYAVSGDIRKAHRHGCAFLDSIYQVKIPKRADIVVVSQGGAPKDLNLYQTQKALDNAKHAVKDGGTIVLIGSCREGLGQQTFEEWITSATSPDELIDRIKNNFELGGHKAAAIALVLKHADIKLVSEMNSDFVKSIFLQPYNNVQKAFDDALAKHGREADVIVMPYGGSTLPVLAIPSI